MILGGGRAISCEAWWEWGYELWEWTEAGLEAIGLGIGAGL